MLNVMPVPAQVATANAPVFAAPSISTPNAQDNRTAATDVQHSLQLFQSQRRKKKEDDFIKKKIRNILAELEDFTGAVGDADDEPEFLWYPPTAFEISQHFVQSRLEYLKIYSITLRATLGKLVRLDPVLKANEAMVKLARGEMREAEGIGEIVERLNEALTALETNKKLLTDEHDTDCRERDQLWTKAKALMEGEDSTPNQVEFNQLTGQPLRDVEQDAVVAGSIGAYNEVIKTLERMRQAYDTFLASMTETVNGNFGTSVLSGGRVQRLPDGRGRGDQIDVGPVTFAKEQRRVRSLMREMGLLRRGFTIEESLKGVQNLPQRVGSYSATDNLLNPKRKEDPLEVFM